MARLQLTYQNLYDRVSHFLGLTTEGTSPSSTNLTLCQDIVHRGIRQFLYPIDVRSGSPYRWSFLERYLSIPIISGQWKYALPVDFSDMLRDFEYSAGEGLPALRKRSAQQIMHYKNLSDTTGWPEYYAIVPVIYDPAIGAIYELWLYPTPSSSYTLQTFYVIDPVKLSATTDLTVGPISVMEAILESCLAVAEIQEDDSTSTVHQNEANRLIQIAIRFDSGKTDTKTIGNLYHGRHHKFDENNMLIRDIDLVTQVYASER